MNVLVLLKQTFDTEEKIRLGNNAILEDGVNFIINPYDEYALEEAIRIKENHGADVTVVTVGPPRAEQALRTALALGADEAVLVEESSLTENGFADEYTVSKVLAAFARRTPFDIILCGNATVDGGSSQTGPRVAEILDIPHIPAVTKLEIDGGRVRVQRDVEGDAVIIEASMPVLVTAQQGLNEPRYPTLPGVMRAKKKEIARLTAADLGLEAAQIKAGTEPVEYFLLSTRRAGKVLSGEPAEQAEELVRLLREEAKAI